MRNSSTNQYLIPPPGYRFRPRWYTRPEFYVPITVAAFVLGGLAIYISMGLSDLKDQAATLDLNRLEQMESASVILDRNDKIFGQIYVENRETIPYEQLPRDLVNAVISVEDAKFYQHHGYAISGILRATFKNLVA
ncbi:MAG TPA: transglycosylase domain-containing protein, partial [Chthoniobacterales bacterium]|nr:transglycosylase domain-containing protein [Chthoniobacterales bacterium]